jgi:hypothetical protein
MPPDTSMTPVSRTIGIDRVVDEMVFEFTHTIKMDWMLPGVEPTGKHVKIPLVGNRPLSRRKTCARTYLLGPGVSAGSAGTDRCRPASCRRGLRPPKRFWIQSYPANELMKR